MANYGGKSPSLSAYQKKFNYGATEQSWNYSTTNGELLLKPINPKATVYIPNDLIVNGSINSPSDVHLKDNIEELQTNSTDCLMKLIPKKYTYKDDKNKKIHFGLIAQEVEEHIPELVKTVSMQINEDEIDIKSVNYLEIVPLLLLKIKDMQNQIDLLNKRVAEK